MKEITTNKLQTELSKVIREVESGEVYEIKRYSKGVAYLVSKEEFEKVVSGTECKKCVADLRKLAKKLN
jgi:prevent-host-death family protein